MKKKILIAILVLVLCLSVFAACKDNGPETDGLKTAKDYVRALYRDEATITGSDYQRVTAIAVDGVTYQITWTIAGKDGSAIEAAKIGEVADGKVTITIDTNSLVDVEYVLTATISDANGKTETVSFNYKVPKFEVLSFDAYKSTATGEPVAVQGVVTGIISKTKGNSSNCLYLNDKDGGYYIYSMADDPVTLGVKVGDTILARGTKDLYSGTHEVKDASIEIVATNGTMPAANDVTALYKAAAAKKEGGDLKDAALNAPQSQLVTIKGVEITSQDTSSGYYRFKLDGMETYVRISSSVCPLTKEEQTAFKAGHTEHTGWIANVTGVICVYDGAFYLTPVTADAFEYVSLPERTPAEQVAYEKENLTLTANFTEDTTYTLPTAGKSYADVAIAWDFKAETTHASASIVGDKLQITLQEQAETITLVATLTVGEGETAVTDTKEFTVLVDAVSLQEYLPEAITEATEGTFKLALYQAKLGTTLYADGTVNGSEYLATTEKADKAADVIVAKSGEGYTLKVGDKFIEIYENTNAKIRIRLVAESTGVWAWNTDAKVFTWTISGTEKNDGEYYLGTYNTYNTLSASKVSYITGDNAANVGVSQFPASMSTLAEADYKAVAITEAAEGTFKLALYQAKLGTTLYADGTVNGSEYLATTDKVDKAADVAVVKSGEGYNLKVGDKFIEVYENTNGKIRIRLVDAATGVWAWNTDAKVFTWTISGTEKNDGEYYLGTYNTYNTLSASKVSYITGDNAANVGVSQFPASCCELVLTKTEFVAISEATEGTFKLALYQAKLGTTLYADGTVNGSEYLATTDKYAKAADVIVAKSGEGYTLKVGDKFIEVYENTNGKIRIRLVAESTGVWAWNTDAKVFTWTISGTEKNDGEYYLGTYNTYNTLSASKVSYITGDNAANVGVSQFPAQLGDKDFVADEPEKQPTAQEIIDGIEIPADAYGDITLSSEATWTVKEGTAIAIEGGVAKVTRGAEDATVVLTATVTIGEDVATKDFTIVVKANGAAQPGATVESALTVAGTYEQFGTLAHQTYSEERVYVKGIVVTKPTFNSQYGSYSCYIADSTAEGAKRVQVYSCVLGDGVAAINENDTIVLYGYIEMYNGMLEVTFKKVDNTTVNGQIVARTAGTSTISYTANENADITLSATSGLNGETFTFTVTAKSGFQVGEVKVNGTVVTAVEGTYTGTIAGNTVVTVETSAAGEALPVVLHQVSFAHSAIDAGQLKNNYTSTWTHTNGGVELAITGFNNGDATMTSWTSIRAGRKSAASVATIATTAAIANKVTSVVVNVEQVDKLDKLNAFYLEYSASATFEGAKRIDGTLAAGEVVFNIPSEDVAANLYFRLVVDSQATGANGCYRISDLIIKGINA